MEWLLVEVLMFGFFATTMLFTLCKSRFMSVGMDNSTQFEGIQLSFMVNKIIKNIDVSGMENPEEFYVDRERVVMLQGIALKICLPSEYFPDVKKRN